MKKGLMIILAVSIVAGVAGGIAAYLNNNSRDNSAMDQPFVPQSHDTYSLNLMSGKKYALRTSTTLRFTIQNQEGKTLKDFDTVHDKKLHLIVVRKDRTNFQHVHPTFDRTSNSFTITNFSFPADGEYRVFADFTAASAQKDAMGMKIPSTPYMDVVAGTLDKYSPQTLNEDRMSSSVNGFATEITFPHGDSSGGLFWAQNENTFAISISKGTERFKNLETYLGALGHMVVLGPKLEFVHAHALTETTMQQTGLIYFQVNFPQTGRYKLYLQMQASGNVLTFDYVVTAKSMPGDQTSEDSDMKDMGH